MASINDMIQAERRMTDAEAADLNARGFRARVIDFLRFTGFREAGELRHDDGSTTPAFLRQTHLPHIHISVTQTDDLNDVITAIYDAGFTDGGDRIATHWQRFAEAVRRPRRPSATESDIERRLRKLEQQLVSQLPQQS